MAGEGEKLLSGGTEIGAAMALKSLIVIVGLAALTLLGEAAQSSSSAQTAISGPAAKCTPVVSENPIRAVSRDEAEDEAESVHDRIRCLPCSIYLGRSCQPVQVAAPA
jgi:hypothetical protein